MQAENEIAVELNRGFSIEFLIVFVPLALVVTFIIALVFNLEQRREIEVIKLAETRNVDRVVADIENEILLTVTDLMVLAGHHELVEFLEGGGADCRAAIAKEFLVFSTEKGIYDQVRYLDETGVEIVRVNFNNGNPAIVPVGQLQDKSGRYYFTDAFALSHGKVFLSPFDLNMEQGAVEYPLKPMLRIATPVLDTHQRKRGIILLNYIGTNLLDKLEPTNSGSLGNTFLANSDGHWLKGPSASENWGFMYDERNNTGAFSLFPGEWDEIEQKSSGQVYGVNGLVSFSHVTPLDKLSHLASNNTAQSNPSPEAGSKSDRPWVVINQVPREAIKQALYPVRTRFAIVYFVLVGLCLVLSTLLTNYRVARRKAELSLKIFSSAIHQSGESVIITELDGSILYVNPAFEQTYGYSFKEALGRDTNILKSDAHSPEFYKEMWETIEAGENFVAEFINKAKSGKMVAEFKTITPIRDDNGQVIQFISIGKDITELKKATQIAAIHSTSATYAHEINNPLTGIMGTIDLLLMDNTHTDETIEMINDLQGAAKRIRDALRKMESLENPQFLDYDRAKIFDLHNTSEE